MLITLYDSRCTPQSARRCINGIQNDAHFVWFASPFLHPTCKSVVLYGATLFNVGTIVNVPLCSSLSLFLYYLYQPHLFSSFVENFDSYLFLHFLWSVSSDMMHCYNHRTALQVYGPHVFILEWNRSGS